MSAFDASLVLQHSIGLIVLPQSLLTIADVSGNGSITAFDGSMILQRVIDLISCFPADPQCAGKAGNSQREVPELTWNEIASTEGTSTLTLSHSADGKPVQSIDLTVQFDPTQYAIDQFEYMLPSSWQVFVNESEGRIQIAGAGSPERLAPDLIQLQMKPTADAREGSRIQAQVSLDESPLGTATVQKDQDLPVSFELSGNYPNPFNPETTIKYFLPESAQVHLEVFDLTGRSVAVLVNNESQAEGEYTVNFDASSLPSGIYVYRLEANDFQQTRKMTMLK